MCINSSSLRIPPPIHYIRTLCALDRINQVIHKELMQCSLSVSAAAIFVHNILYTFCPYLSLSYTLPISASYFFSSLSLYHHSLSDCTPSSHPYTNTRIHSCPNIYPYGKNPKENINICVCGRKIQQYKVHNTFVTINGVQILHANTVIITVVNSHTMSRFIQTRL
jgi:hypothetical protein